MIKPKYYFTIGPIIYTGLNCYLTSININWNNINVATTIFYFITHIITTLSISEIFLTYMLIPFTKSTISTVASSCGEAGYTYLPSGIILQWGTWDTSASGYTVALSIAFPNALLNVQLTPYFSGAGVTNALALWIPAGPTSTSTFTVGTTVNGTPVAAVFSYLAIGY